LLIWKEYCGASGLSIVLDGDEDEENNDAISDNDETNSNVDGDVTVNEPLRGVRINHLIWHKQGGKGEVVDGSKTFHNIYDSKFAEVKKWKKEYEEKVKADSSEMMNDYDIENIFIQKKVCHQSFSVDTLLMNKLFHSLSTVEGSKKNASKNK
jgi:hypothetical protein